MKALINERRAVYGVEPICRVLPIASSTYCAHARCQADPERRSRRAQREDVLSAHIQRSGSGSKTSASTVPARPDDKSGATACWQRAVRWSG